MTYKAWQTLTRISLGFLEAFSCYCLLFKCFKIRFFFYLKDIFRGLERDYYFLNWVLNPIFLQFQALSFLFNLMSSLWEGGDEIGGNLVSQVTLNSVWVGHHSRLPPPLFFFCLLFILYVWVLCLYVCQCTITCSTWGGQKGMSGFLELELLVVVSYHVLAGN